MRVRFKNVTGLRAGGSEGEKVMLGRLWAGSDAGLSECWWGTKIGGIPINGRSISHMALRDDTTAGNHR